MRIPEKRLEGLEYMAHNMGYRESTVEDAKKRGKDILKAPHGTMIVVSPVELRELLRAYRNEPVPTGETHEE